MIYKAAAIVLASFFSVASALENPSIDNNTGILDKRVLNNTNNNNNNTYSNKNNSNSNNSGTAGSLSASDSDNSFLNEEFFDPERLDKVDNSGDFELKIKGSGSFSAYYAAQQDPYKVGSGGKFSTRLISAPDKHIEKTIAPSAATGAGDPYDSSLIGDYSNNSAFSSGAGLSITAKKKLNEDISYGTNLDFGISTNASRAIKINNAYIFLETTYGKFELGQNKGAAEAFRLDASTISAIGSGIANGWYNSGNVEGFFKSAVFKAAGSTDNARDLAAQHPFHVVPNLYTEYTRTGGNWKRQGNDIAGIYAPKITYYSPEYSGFLLGVSYTNDESNIWNGGYSKKEYKNVFSGGVSYEGEYENIKYKLAATGERGAFNDKSNPTIREYFDLNGWNLGFNITYASFKVGGSFANLYKSGIPTQYNNDDLTKAAEPRVAADPGNTTYWTLGGAYEVGPAMVSLSYFRSVTSPHQKDQKNTLSDIGLGAHYHLSGKKYQFTPYIAYNYFITDEYNATKYGAKDSNSNNRGSVIQTGVKVVF